MQRRLADERAIEAGAVEHGVQIDARFSTAGEWHDIKRMSAGLEPLLPLLGVIV